MKFLKIKYPFFIVLLVSLFACQKEDDTYESVPVTTQPDLITALQNTTITISVLDNDGAIPQGATLSITTPEQGVAVINTNETQTIADDVIAYTANETFTGSVVFQYTICTPDGVCTSENITVTITPANQVVLNIEEVPYLKLSDYNFFTGNLSELEPNAGLLPYKPISSLFSDYALKKRFIYVPPGQKARYNGDAEPIDFPTGSVLIKTFYYDNVLPLNNTVIIETRLMIKKDSGWIFAEYFWNDEQTEAFLDEAGDGGTKYIQWLQDGVQRELNYSMPSGSACFTCHKSNTENFPIGVRPQSLNDIYTYEDGVKNQLQKWIEVGYLEDNLPADIHTVVDYNDTTKSLELRVRSYVDINCASCHSDEGHCNYRPMRFAFDENDDPINLGVCVEPDQNLSELSEDQKLIKPGDPENSVIFHRVNATAENIRMPLLGRQIVHDEGIALLASWINSLEEPCN